jgi:hypothetical protein
MEGKHTLIAFMLTLRPSMKYLARQASKGQLEDAIRQAGEAVHRYARNGALSYIREVKRNRCVEGFTGKRYSVAIAVT